MASLDVGWLWSVLDSDAFAAHLGDAVQSLGCSGLPLTQAALARGCACADDDSPAIELVPEYAELCLTLSHQMASSRLVLC